MVIYTSNKISEFVKDTSHIRLYHVPVYSRQIMKELCKEPNRLN